MIFHSEVLLHTLPHMGNEQHCMKGTKWWLRANRAVRQGHKWNHCMLKYWGKVNRAQRVCGTEHVMIRTLEIAKREGKSKKTTKTQVCYTIILNHHSISFIVSLYHWITLEEVWPMTGSNVLPYSAAADKCFQVIINFSFSFKYCELCAGRWQGLYSGTNQACTY